MDEQLDPLTRRIIGCAITVHRYLGPGLLESVYRTALSIEMELEGVSFDREPAVAVIYRGKTLGEFHPDFIVQDEVVVEVKSVSSHEVEERTAVELWSTCPEGRNQTVRAVGLEPRTPKEVLCVSVSLWRIKSDATRDPSV